MGLGVMQPGQRLSSNMVDGVDYQKAEPFVAYKNAYTEIKWDPLGKRCEMQGGTCVNEAIKHCDHRTQFYNECGKAMCKAHVQLNKRWVRNLEIYSGYQC